jgi:parallel beta-helix repeat protein
MLDSNLGLKAPSYYELLRQPTQELIKQDELVPRHHAEVLYKSAGTDIKELIIVEGASENTINQNNFTTNSFYGIRLTSSDTTGNIFVKNNVLNNGVDISEYGGVIGNKWVNNTYDTASPNPPQ